MKITVIGSHLCPDTLVALNKLSAVEADIDFKDILSCHAYLKEYLRLRDTNALYEEIRGTESLGIPCFVLENNEITMDIKKALEG
ncbi:glutaredoxin [Clostridium botulinum]|uniref:glutaredoxin n=1 Tax=Clostridium botulinum TaxID=1491 RepID=UPI0007E1FF0E|nr:glutaredoxin [Clostridium botulinum]KEI92321.1 glutaredoxin [Clostridium botulinum B2 275]NFD55900.1 glutaredoxin [Clostridium botulinum]